MSSRVFSTISHGWKCLRFWMSSPSKYSSKKLDVIYKSENYTISGINFTSITPGWVYLQSPIPREENNLQVVIEGKRDEYASLSVDDITYTKYQCQSIPGDNSIHTLLISFSQKVE
ncbi:hypothetical protein AC249_AIPGENE11946 [Exaiptasia diaphana]|nr:hypothetical protein AC249_AIPGENE11946 [Exaiptasia diaphana]